MFFSTDGNDKYLYLHDFQKNIDRLFRYFFRFSPSIFFRGGSDPPLLKMDFENLTA